jgi:hypothetical protein
MKKTLDTPNNNQWNPEEGLAANNDSRPTQAIPAEGQETSDGWSGFASPEKFSNQGSQPIKIDPYKE